MKLMTRRSFSVQALALALACVMTLPTWAATPTVTPELPDPGSTSITKEQQEQLGLQATAEVYKQMPVHAGLESSHTNTSGKSERNCAP
jgi:hypothetical protein